MPVFNWECVECDIAHSLSVAVLCLLYKIRCKPMHLLDGALPVPHVSVQVTRNALVAHRNDCPPNLLQNLAVSQDFYSSLSVSVERSC